MAKSIIAKSQRKDTEPNRLNPHSEKDSESFRALQSENQRLRELVVYLSAAMLRNIVFDPARGSQAVSSADAKQLNRVLDILPKPFPGRELLTPRERAVLAQIVKGASSKEAAQTLAISARTVEFHRASILFKLAAKNTAELVRIVLGE
jgi:DNA-binding CsgD family transcriptional regulator